MYTTSEIKKERKDLSEQTEGPMPPIYIAEIGLPRGPRGVWAKSTRPASTGGQRVAWSGQRIASTRVGHVSSPGHATSPNTRGPHGLNHTCTRPALTYGFGKVWLLLARPA